MNIRLIRTNLTALMLSESIVNEMSPYPPESVGSMPFGYLGDAEADVTMGSLEVWAYVLPLVIVVARQNQYTKELSELEDRSVEVMSAIRANYTLAIPTVYGVNVTKWREGVIEIAGSPFVGTSFRLGIKEKFPVALEG